MWEGEVEEATLGYILILRLPGPVLYSAGPYLISTVGKVHPSPVINVRVPELPAFRGVPCSRIRT